MITLPPALQAALDRRDTVVVPSRQRAHAVRLAHARAALAQGHAVWATPDVLPADAWVLREVERSTSSGRFPRVLSAAEDWWLWREATRHATRDSALAGVSALAEALRRADRLADEHGIDVSRWLAVGGRETQLLDEVQRAVRRARRERDADSAQRIARDLPVLGGACVVHFAGFAAADVPRARALHARRQAQGLAGEWGMARAAGCNPVVERASDETEEIECIADWCLRRLEASRDARLLVVASGGSELREAIATQVRAALAPSARLAGSVDAELVAIDGGSPLTRQALVQHALAGLAWLIEGLEFEVFSDWLRSPYGPLTLASSARLDLWWRRRAPLEADAPASLALLGQAAAEGHEPARELATRARDALTALEAGPASARVWSERFSAALAALRPPERQADSAEQQTWLRFVALLDEFGAVSRVAGSLDSREALHALRDLATRTTWQPATGDALVTIAPDHDDPIVRYDGLWVAGLAADTWPAPPLLDAFIPLPALRDAGLAAATTAGRLAAAHASLEAWRASAQSLVLSAPIAAGDTQLSPSPLLAAWPERARESAPRAPLALALRVRRDVRLERLDDIAGSSWPASDPLPGGTRSLELQAACPFRAYAEQQLAAAPLDEPAIGIERDERGRWLHRALELFWRGIGDSGQLGRLTTAELGTCAADAVAAARDAALAPPRAIAIASRERESRRLTRLVMQFAQFERTRAEFSIVDLEKEYQVALGDARLTVRIDRIDKLAAGGRVVIDYKSGQLTRQDWYGERPTAVQLLVYLAALGGGVRALANARVAPPSACFKGIAAKDELLPGVRGVFGSSDEPADAAWTRQAATWQAQVRGLADEFLRAEATVTPAQGACRRCHLAALCRVGERARVEAEEGADG